MPTVMLMPTDMSHWADGTRHYRTSDGLDLAVEATDPTDWEVVIPQGAQPMVDELLVVAGTNRAAVKQVVRPTVILACTSDGFATDLTPLHTFAPGTTHEDALQMAGYTMSTEE